MSYILEALKKSERERNLGKVPRLGTLQETASPASRGPSRPWLVPVLLINTVLLLGLLGYLIAAPAAPGGLWAKWSQDTAPPAGNAEKTAVATTGADETATPAVAAIPKNPAQAPSVTPVTPAPVAGQQEPAAETDIQKRQAGEAPSLSELPEEFRQRVVIPTLEVHVYSVRPDRRFIMTDGRQYQEGDRLPGDLKLEKITPSGIELSHQDQRFHLDR